MSSPNILPLYPSVTIGLKASALVRARAPTSAMAMALYLPASTEAESSTSGLAVYMRYSTAAQTAFSTGSSAP